MGESSHWPLVRWLQLTSITARVTRSEWPEGIIGWPLRDRQQPQAGKGALWVEERCKQRPRGSKAVASRNQAGFTAAVA